MDVDPFLQSIATSLCGVWCRLPPHINVSYYQQTTIYPSDAPSLIPSLSPSGDCRNEGLLEITTEKNELTYARWGVKDMFGNTVISNNGLNDTDIFRYTRECLPRVSCYTFLLYSSSEDEPIVDSSRAFYSVKFDGEVLASSEAEEDKGAAAGDRTTMFGPSCLQNGDNACTKDETISMSMFRLEHWGQQITWSLLDGSKQVVQSLGPFGKCNANTLAMCLPREDCYEFTISSVTGDGRCCSSDQGQYTVTFSHVENMIQNITGPILDTHQVFLGNCYDMNFY